MPALRVVILPSVGFGVLLSILHLAAAAFVGGLPMPAWPKAALITAGAWSLKRCLDEFALLRARRAIVAIHVTREGRVIARTRGGAWLECELLASSFVSHRLTVLNLRAGEGRRLRVWLRWASGKSLNHYA